MGEAEAAVGRVKPDWVVADVGNTHVKFGAFSGGRLDSVNCVRHADLHSDVQFSVPRGVRAACLSVNPVALERVLKIAEIGDWNVRVVLRSDGGVFQPGLISSDVTTPESTGVDRVLACIGALLETPDQTVVVVDCGTATTVNVMTSDRCFRGGMIAPGRMLLAWSLQRGTAALPEVTPTAAMIEIGTSTQEAIHSGINASFLGGIRECVDVVQKKHPLSSVYLTGGDAEFAHQFFPEFRRVDWLTLKGLHWFATHCSP